MFSGDPSIWLSTAAVQCFSASVARVWRYRNLFITITITITVVPKVLAKIQLTAIVQLKYNLAVFF